MPPEKKSRAFPMGNALLYIISRLAVATADWKINDIKKTQPHLGEGEAKVGLYSMKEK